MRWGPWRQAPRRDRRTADVPLVTRIGCLGFKPRETLNVGIVQGDPDKMKTIGAILFEPARQIDLTHMHAGTIKITAH
jgi:hypothetical protein